MITGKTDGELCHRIAAADRRYGPFTSTHEALGVCSEEWDELRAAIHRNDFDAIQHEALDLAAALIRLNNQLAASVAMRERSAKD
jgi:NTP pyrophosphatase (non-canonical NTP hydrolase)